MSPTSSSSFAFLIASAAFFENGDDFPRRVQKEPLHFAAAPFRQNVSSLLSRYVVRIRIIPSESVSILCVCFPILTVT